MPTARTYSSTNTGVAPTSQGYILGKARGMTIMYGNAAVTSGWLPVVTNNVGGSIAGAGRQPMTGPSRSYVGSATTRSKTMYSALGGSSVSGDFGVVRAGKYIMLGGNITNLLANSKTYYGLVGGASDNGSRKSFYARYGSTSIKPTVFTLTLTYSGETSDSSGAGYTYPTLTVTNGSGVSGDYAMYDQTTQASGTATSDNATNLTRALPGRMCYSINGKVPTTVYYLADTD